MTCTMVATVARQVKLLKNLADRYALRGSCAPWASIWETV